MALLYAAMAVVRSFLNSSGIKLKQIGFWVAWAIAKKILVASNSPKLLTCRKTRFRAAQIWGRTICHWVDRESLRLTRRKSGSEGKEAVLPETWIRRKCFLPAHMGASVIISVCSNCAMSFCHLSETCTWSKPPAGLSLWIETDSHIWWS